jgi:hypothetical protein
VLQLKDLRGGSVGERVTDWDRKILEELEGLRGGRAWFAGREGIVPNQQNHYSTSVQFINSYL